MKKPANRKYTFLKPSDEFSFDIFAFIFFLVILTISSQVHET